MSVVLVVVEKPSEHDPRRDQWGAFVKDVQDSVPQSPFVWRLAETVWQIDSNETSGALFRLGAVLARESFQYHVTFFENRPQWMSAPPVLKNK